MTNLLFEPQASPAVPVAGGGALFPAGRIFCVGRNYAEHAREMGMPAEPIFFMKPVSSLVTGETAPYPPDTKRFDHEIELVLALGAGGRPRTPDEARALIAGYAVGLDLTRRDVQAQAKSNGEPWEAAKAFDAAAPISPIRLASETGPIATGRIWLEVDGEIRQDGKLEDMLLPPGELLVALARTWTLNPGDLVFTGTPHGVGPLQPGQTARGGVDGVGELTVRIV